VSGSAGRFRAVNVFPDPRDNAVSCEETGDDRAGHTLPVAGGMTLEKVGHPVEEVTLAGRDEPFPMSEVAARRLDERLDEARAGRSAAEAEAFEERIADRIAARLADGTPSIDVATMRSIVDFIDTPGEEEEPEPTGLGKMVSNLSDKFQQRGYTRYNDGGRDPEDNE
jgi:hypothetical protein